MPKLIDLSDRRCRFGLVDPPFGVNLCFCIYDVVLIVKVLSASDMLNAQSSQTVRYDLAIEFLDS